MTFPSIRFEWAINVGHIITILGAITVVAVGYLDLQRDVQQNSARLSVVENRLETAHARLATQDLIEERTRGQIDRLEELMAEVRDALREITKRAAP